VCVWEQGAQPGHVHAPPVVSGLLAALAEEAACTCGSCKYLTRYLPRLGRTLPGAGGVHGQSICVYFFRGSRGTTCCKSRFKALQVTLKLCLLIYELPSIHI